MHPSRLVVLGVFATMAFDYMMEDRVDREHPRFELDHKKTNEILMRDRIPLAEGTQFKSVNVYKKDFEDIGANRLGVAFSARSGTKIERYIRDRDFKIRDLGEDRSETVVFTTNGPTKGNIGESCSRKIIGHHFTTYTCRVLDERDLAWVKRAAAQAGYGKDFPVAYMPYTPPVFSKISEAVRQQARQSAQALKK